MKITISKRVKIENFFLLNLSLGHIVMEKGMANL